MIQKINFLNFSCSKLFALLHKIAPNYKFSNKNVLFWTLVYETEKLVNKAKICIEQRDQIRKTLLLDFSVTKSNPFLREFLRSDRGEYADITEKIDIKLVILQETLKTLKYQDQKVEIILEFMNSDDFQTKEELTKVLSVVKDEDPTLLEKIYDTMNTS